MNRATARRMLSSYIEEPVASFLARLGVSPNAVTLFGLVGAGASAYLLSIGLLWAGGVMLLAAGAIDLFDGALARATDRVSKFGALLDSVVDRLSEIAVLLGLLVFYLNSSSTLGALLVYLALSGSIMVSYLRARAGGLGIECRIGFMTRPERVVALGVGTIVGHFSSIVLFVALGAIAGLTLLTMVQRIYHTWRTVSVDGSE